VNLNLLLKFDSLNRILLTPNFYLDEYIPKDIYLQYKDDPDVLIRKLNKDLPAADQLLRDRFGPAYINTWRDGGDKNYSGWRPASSTIGATLSDHREGNASDKVFEKATAEEVRQWLMKDNNWRRLGITVIESGTSWVHSSVAWNKNRTGLWIVTPNM